MNIILAPNPILSQTAKPVSKIDRSVLKIINEMKKALDEARDPIGVGLAAPQIGKLLRIFIVRPNPKAKTLVFLNPKITEAQRIPRKMQNISGSVDSSAHSVKKRLEGCLSLKDIWGSVLRSPNVSLSYLDENGKKHKKSFKGLMATIIQHETDHLHGVLFTKRVLEQKGKLYQSHKNKKGEDVFEEIKI